MDPIEAQIQAQLQSIQSNPNFSSYQPSFSDIGIAPLQSLDISSGLVQEPLPNISDVVKKTGMNMVKNKVANLFAKKIGIETLPQGSFFGGSMLSNAAAPVALFSGISAIKNKIANRNLMAAVNRESTNELQRQIDAGMYGSNTPTSQDAARTNYGGGSSISPNRSTGTSAERGAALHG
tara:strand:+ start:110 stop:646 length:537 start_codon:yes stop_codon:yes gene_type:complete